MITDGTMITEPALKEADGRCSLLVGIHVHTDVAALLGTLDALADALHEQDQLVLLPDGPDPAMADDLRTHPRLLSLTQWGTAQSSGGPAAFNRLAAGRPAEVGAVVLLESGARPAPDSLARLAVALDQPGVGLAGPSTNDAWNEQCALPHGTGDVAGLRDGARQLAARHGDGSRSLAPLHSIADLCIAVSGPALTALGAADEGFAQGPCWEMEYAARGARAGFAAVWVGAAYVHRSPATRRRREEEVRSFEASRHRYQDRLCGLRLSGLRSGYVPHCEGEACSHFAPSALIALHLLLPSAELTAPSPAPPPVAADPVEATHPVGEDRVLGFPTRTTARASDQPLVSCVMPTADRPDWVARAIEYFHRQDYPNRELVIVDDGTEDLRRQIPGLLDHPAIMHLRLSGRISIGTKRNLGCDRASGEVLMQWDDDDWYGPSRVSTQAVPLLARAAEITGLRDAVWFEVDQWRFRQPTPDQHRRLFVEDVHGGTLAFHRTLWERGCRYPNLSLAEDAWFLQQSVRTGARLSVLPAAGVYLYVRHGANSWRLPPQYGGPDGWDQIGEPPELAQDREFYAARSGHAPAVVAPTTPLASAIMPTANRRQFVPGAVKSFLAQSYSSVELVVVDDGDEPVQDLLPADPRLRYLRLTSRRLVGEKRNIAVEAARGEVILHFDDDDWSHPDRVRVQVDALATGAADVCGLSRMLWWDLEQAAAWRFTCPPLRRPWVAGNTLAYLRSTWSRSPFPVQAMGEDTAFVWGLSDRRVLPLDDERLVIGTMHATNTSTKRTTGDAWSPVDTSEIRRAMAGTTAGETWLA